MAPGELSPGSLAPGELRLAPWHLGASTWLPGTVSCRPGYLALVSCSPGLLEPGELYLAPEHRVMLSPAHGTGERRWLLDLVSCPTWLPGTVSCHWLPGTGELPPGSLAPSELSPGSLAPGELSPGSLAPGELPPGSLAPSELSPGSLAPGELSAGTATGQVPGELPPGSLAPSELSPASQAPGELSAGTATGQAPPCNCVQGSGSIDDGALSNMSHSMCTFLDRMYLEAEQHRAEWAISALGQSSSQGAEEGLKGSAAAVFSVFGLQQLGPAAPQALASWVCCLAPGGFAVVIIWPSDCDEHNGPWSLYDQVLRQKDLDMGKPVPPSPPPGSSWEDRLVSTVLDTVPGSSLVTDELVYHQMTWPGGYEQMWEVMTYGGPWHARRLAFGDEHMHQLRDAFLAAAARHTGRFSTGRPDSSSSPYEVIRSPIASNSSQPGLASHQTEVCKTPGAEALRRSPDMKETSSSNSMLSHTPKARLLVFKKASCADRSCRSPDGTRDPRSML
eukprot:gene10214-8130_t